jgi:hypothetical protein
VRMQKKLIGKQRFPDKEPLLDFIQKKINGALIMK